ncbi:probable inactive shikimate kinase like 1, chloroplastic isoform X1 [Phragmites australis]|uniref:probable inactive shikimate kinase like 1, chloroplastic isoform X1 n=1 Tax=Phragmites australis TaxID=29695 RepID=UPI002D7917D1|nr:probable inactive shikimate kinase like 1, chloroplastic isoform X1 [Phragmites australis]
MTGTRKRERERRERRHGDASSCGGGGGGRLLLSLLCLPEALPLRHTTGITLHRALHPSPSSPRLPKFIADSELTLEELNPSVDLLRKTAEAVGDFRKTPIYIVGMDCTAKRNITKLLANSIIYRYLCSEELLEDVLGGKDALRAFRESDGKGYLEVETEGLKQLTSMGSLVLCCGDGAVMNSTNLGLLRHGVSIWIDVPLEMVVNDILKSTGTQAITDPDSFSQAMSKLRQQYDELKERYGVSDITVSVQNVASQLGYSSVDSVTLEDMVLEIVRQIERLIRTKAMMEAAGRPF